jgi:hypothetical protein
MALGLVLLISNPLITAYDYSLDYGLFCVSGIVWETTDYKIVDFVSEMGVSQGLQTSIDYSVSSVVGMEDETSSVSDWMLY